MDSLRPFGLPVEPFWLPFGFHLAAFLINFRLHFSFQVAFFDHVLASSFPFLASFGSWEYVADVPPTIFLLSEKKKGLLGYLLQLLHKTCKSGPHYTGAAVFRPQGVLNIKHISNTIQ